MNWQVTKFADFTETLNSFKSNSCIPLARRIFDAFLEFTEFFNAFPYQNNRLGQRSRSLLGMGTWSRHSIDVGKVSLS